MSNIAGSSVYSSANTSTSTLRPRNNRLISYLEETPSDNDVLSQTTSASTSRGGSPSAAQARNRSVAQPPERTCKQTQNQAGTENAGRRPSTLWDSWSSIQGAASSLLNGGEASTSVGRKGSVKTPAWMKQDPKFKTAPTVPKWGLSSKDSAEPEPGSTEDRQAMVQAKRREALLLSCAQEGRNEFGHFKRKASYDAGANNNSYTSDLGQDMLVYKHKVLPQDTMAGVTIKYSCQPEAFRKMNRFWPSDNIQTRSIVLLPVNACGIRGEKLDDVSSLELLNKQLGDSEHSTKRSSTSRNQPDPLSDSSSITTSPSPKSAEEEKYRHDSFVVLPSFPGPVEILRVPRNTVGYFPRPRRKSNHYPSESLGSTPKTSFDMLRHPPSHAAQQAAAALHSSPQNPLQSASLNTSPVRRPSYFTRQRSSSTTVTTNTNSDNAWFLKGPGGVGTLRGLRTEVSRPGPADDSLNQKFAHYFPSLAIQSDAEDQSDVNPNHLLTPRSRTNTMSRSPYRATSRVSTDSIRSTRSNSSTFGAGVTGVESFMRKLASGKRPDMPRSNSGNLVNSMGILIGGESGLGDLIELETTPDALHLEMRPTGDERNERADFDCDDDDDATPIAETSKGQEELLNERFPIRGRITRAYARDDD